MKKILSLLRNILVAPFLLYIYNMIGSSTGYIIPINLFNILFVGILGIPGLITLILFLIVCF